MVAGALTNCFIMLPFFNWQYSQVLFEAKKIKGVSAKNSKLPFAS